MRELFIEAVELYSPDVAIQVYPLPQEAEKDIKGPTADNRATYNTVEVVSPMA